MIWKGRLERRDLEGGIWVLHTPDGEVTLRGHVPKDLAGAEVVVEGERDDGFGFDMTGPAAAVKRITRR